jgi:superfamily II DNA or RNA helicase
MTRRNYRPEPCAVCGTHVAAKAGYLYGPPWSVKCEPCSGEVSSAATQQQVIRVALDGVAAATIRPGGFLGREAFRAYQAACAGVKFDAARKCQVCPLSRLANVLKSLVAAGFVCDVAPELGTALVALSEKTKGELVAAAGRADAVDAKLRATGGTLYPFQRAGVTWLASRTSGALLADQMGLGKTVQALASLPERAPVIVVCPALAKGVWAREAAKWRPDYSVSVLSGSKTWRLPVVGEIVVASYGILPTELGSVPAGLVVLADEIHACKNTKAARTVRFRALATAARAAGGRTIGLTGTPLLNSPPETWSILQALGLGGEAFGNWDCFAAVMGGYRGSYGYEWGTPRDPEAVGTCLKRVMLRRVRAEVLPELPVKTYREISCEIDRATSKVCDAAITALGPELTASFATSTGIAATTANVLPSFQQISAARKALATAKLPSLLALVEEYEEQSEPLVVFSAHLEPIQALAGRPGWAIITGDTPSVERTRIEDRFQAGELKGVAATIKAGGVAITLTRAAHAVFVDRDWTPALNDQAEDRVCRIGQTRGCLITILVADHALDQRIAELLGSKSATIEATVEQGRQKSCAVHTDCQECTELGAACAAHALIVSASQVQTVDLGALAAQAATAQATQASAKLEAERIAAERAAHFAAEREIEAKEREAKAKKEKQEKKQVAARARATKAGWVAPTDAADRHEARTARQVWAARAIVQLTNSDPDHAAKKNKVGFSKADVGNGHWLAGELSQGLTPRQWGLAVQLCAKYHGQVGEMPAREDGEQEVTTASSDEKGAA